MLFIASFTFGQTRINTCTSSDLYALIDFNGSLAPTLTDLCNNLGNVSITRIDVGLYTVEIAGGFPENTTWMYLQSETNIWRELMIEWQPGGKLFIQAVQNGVLTDIVNQNVSFELRVFY